MRDEFVMINKGECMQKHWKYLGYVVRHRWFVFLEACKLGIPWRGLMHDMSKFRPSEWLPYAEHFKGGIQRGRDSTGYYCAGNTGDAKFDFARHLHQKRNPHHWQWWVLQLNHELTKVLPMPDKYRREMLADWRGAGRAQGTPDTRAWYIKHYHDIILHEDTRQWLDEQLDVI